MFLRSLSGRFLLLTIIFVMLAEVLIFVPSVARFRQDYLQERLERSQIASLALLATSNDMVEPDLEAELLENAGVLNVVLRRNAARELILTSPIPAQIAQEYDLRNATAMGLMRDALATMMRRQDRVIAVMGEPVKDAGLLIEVAMEEAPLRAAILDYGLRILILSLILSVTTATLLFFIVRRFVVFPIDNLVGRMKDYERAPEDARKIIEPGSSVVEIFEAERALNSMQNQLSQSLRQKKRLAELGTAVSKISHDLRNMLTTAQLLADMMDASDDPRVKKRAPKLVSSISRAVKLCEDTLAFGKAEETAPVICQFSMQELLNDVVENETLAVGEAPVRIVSKLDDDITMTGDAEQIFRVMTNLTRNARQVLAARDCGGQVTLTGARNGAGWVLQVSDDGPGLPAEALENLFTPFQGSARVGGSGLGLAIAAELVAGHGGKIEVKDTGPEGTTFEVWLPEAA